MSSVSADLSSACIGAAEVSDCGVAAMAMHFSAPVGATCQIGDGLLKGGSGDDCVRRRHAVHQPENFELGLELVGDAVDDQIGFADRIFNRGDKCDGREGLRAQLLADRLARMVKIAGHDVLKKDAITGAGRAQREPAAKGPRSDNGDGDHLLKRTGEIT